MSELLFKKPVLIMLYGFPGSGKTYLAHRLSADFGLAFVEGDRIRHEVFAKPSGSDKENKIVGHISDYMSQEFLKSGTSVVIDSGTESLARRREIRNLAKKSGASSLLIWLQIEEKAAATRAITREGSNKEDRYSITHDQKSFHRTLTKMKNPKEPEDFFVISGMHSYPMMKKTIMNKMADMRLIDASLLREKFAKPSLVNLVPKNNNQSDSRRNVTIH